MYKSRGVLLMLAFSLAVASSLAGGCGGEPAERGEDGGGSTVTTPGGDAAPFVEPPEGEQPTETGELSEERIRQGEELVEERCTGCHDLQRTTEAEKDRQGWSETVDRMIDLGAELDEEEKEIVIDYLAYQDARDG